MHMYVFSLSNLQTLFKYIASGEPRRTSTYQNPRQNRETTHHWNSITQNHSPSDRHITERSEISDFPCSTYDNRQVTQGDRPGSLEELTKIFGDSSKNSEIEPFGQKLRFLQKLHNLKKNCRYLRFRLLPEEIFKNGGVLAHICILSLRRPGSDA